MGKGTVNRVISVVAFAAICCASLWFCAAASAQNGNATLETSGKNIVLTTQISQKSEKEIYLTFDDGPCACTCEILDTLKANGVTATFFVVGREAEKYPAIVRRIHSEGHTLAAHCYVHDYKTIYNGADAFKADMMRCVAVLKGIVPDYSVSLMRFAGGSFGLPEKYLAAARELGLRYIDWNAANGDAERIYDAREAAAYAIQTSSGKNRIVMLMHDNKSVTVASLPSIIAHFKSEGYIFKSF